MRVYLYGLILSLFLLPTNLFAEDSWEYGAAPEDGGISFLGLKRNDSPVKVKVPQKTENSSFLQHALESYEVLTAKGYGTTIAWGTPLYVIGEAFEKGLLQAYPATELVSEGKLTPRGEVAEQALHEVFSALESKCQPYAGTLVTLQFSQWADQIAKSLKLGGNFTEHSFIFPADFHPLATAALKTILHSTAKEINESSYKGISEKRQEKIRQLTPEARKKVLDDEFHKFRYYLSLTEFVGTSSRQLDGAFDRGVISSAKRTWKRAHDAYLYISSFSDFKPFG